MSATALHNLLGPTDPPPVEVLHHESDAPVFLLCEHAGRAIPQALGDLGLPETARASHIGWDIGAAGVARKLADTLRAPLVLQAYSRLVVDANRPPGTVGFIPKSSGGVDIPGNKSLSQAERSARRAAIFDPMNHAIGIALSNHRRRVVISVHSFTPRLQGTDRPWHCGFLSRSSPDIAEQLLASVAETRPDFNLAVNEPYRIEDETDWFIPVHAEKRSLPNCLVEIRNDQIGNDAGVDLWANLLAEGITRVLRGMP